jgi:branched-chain amino acid transport system permease protein
MAAWCRSDSRPSSASAYGLVYLADTVGVDPFISIPLAAAACSRRLANSYLVFRLAGGCFAIGTWVLAEVAKLLMTQVDTLGAGSASPRLLVRPAHRIAYVYWVSLGTPWAPLSVSIC